jgi:hypothetical protein
MSQLETYLKELEMDTSVSDFNLKEVQMKLPALKHKWVGRYIRHKQELQKIQRTKDKTSKNLVEETIKQAPIDLKSSTSANAVARMVENTESIQILNERIEELKLIVELLEKAEKILSNMSFDLKNIVEIQKLETM